MPLLRRTCRLGGHAAMADIQIHIPLRWTHRYGGHTTLRLPTTIYDMKALAPDFKQSFGALSVLMTAKERPQKSKETGSTATPELPSPETGHKRP